MPFCWIWRESRTREVLQRSDCRHDPSSVVRIFLLLFPVLELLFDVILVAGIGRHIVFLSFNSFRQMFLIDNVVRIVVGIFVALSVAEFLHQWRRGIAQMQGHG